jgi:hypothetical protein
MATLKSGLNSGSGFSNSDTVTSTTLNNHVNDGGIVAGTIATADMATSTGTSDGVTCAKMQQINTDRVLGRVSSSTGVVEELTAAQVAALISTSIRPKFVTATTSGSTALSQTITSGTGTTTFTYNINEFTSGDSDFNVDGTSVGYKKIVGVHIQAFAQSDGALQQITVTYPDGAEVAFCASAAYSTADHDQSETSVFVPINSTQSTITIKHIRRQDGTDTSTFSKILGYTINPALPTS